MNEKGQDTGNLPTPQPAAADPVSSSEHHVRVCGRDFPTSEIPDTLIPLPPEPPLPDLQGGPMAIPETMTPGIKRAMRVACRDRRARLLSVLTSQGMPASLIGAYLVADGWRYREWYLSAECRRRARCDLVRRYGVAIGTRMCDEWDKSHPLISHW